MPTMIKNRLNKFFNLTNLKSNLSFKKSLFLIILLDIKYWVKIINKI